MQFIELENGYKVIDEIPQWKIDNAVEFVNSCLNNKIGFCYSRVRKYPLDTGRKFRELIELLRKERLEVDKSKFRLQNITIELAELRQKEKEHYLFDELAYKNMLSNFKKLESALKLLVEVGEIEAYTLTRSGILRVEWWTEHETIEIKETLQAWPLPEKIEYKEISDTNKTVPIPSTNAKCKHMVKAVANPKATKGSGELDPYRLKQRDRDREYWEVQQRALYLNAKEQKEKDNARNM